jgi:hypothetical protein
VDQQDTELCSQQQEPSEQTSNSRQRRPARKAGTARAPLQKEGKTLKRQWVLTLVVLVNNS